MQPGVDHLDAGVTQGARDHFRAAVVPVETRLRDDDAHPSGVRHDLTSRVHSSVSPAPGSSADLGKALSPPKLCD